MSEWSLMSRIHKVVSGAVLVVGVTLLVLGRLRLLWLLPLGRWFFVLFATAASVEFFWTVFSRSATRVDRMARRFLMIITSVAALGGTLTADNSVRWSWWLTTVAILWIPQLVPANRYLQPETGYDKRAPQWRDTVVMAIPAVAVLVGFGFWFHHLHQIQVTERARCPHGLYKLMSPDHSSYDCVRTGLH